MMTVKIVYKDGTEDFKDCFDIADISLVGVVEVKVIREKGE